MKILKGEVSVVDTLLPKEFNQQHFVPRKPVVLTTYTKSWECMNKWSIDYFRKYQKEEKFIAVLKNGLSHPPNREIKMHFGDFLDMVEKQMLLTKEDDHYYLQQTAIDEFDGLREDFKWPDLFLYCQNTFLGDNTLFIGSGHIRTTMHYDRPLIDNLFCQIIGKKRVRLWKPSMGKYMYPFSFDTNYSHVSQIPELDQVDYDKFPDFKNAIESVDLILEAGESLYIPKGWWHHVSHCGDISISMNFWYL